MTYEIWIEGFVISGGYGHATLLGTSEGQDFKDAVCKWYDAHPIRLFNFNAENLTDWGCGLFPTEAEAKKRFG